jgi:hypothetical protein
LGESNGLGLAFWTETPSGKFEQLADVKTKKISKGDETAYKAKIKSKEEGYYAQTYMMITVVLDQGMFFCAILNHHMYPSHLETSSSLRSVP